jgi:hypothetical protein
MASQGQKQLSRLTHSIPGCGPDPVTLCAAVVRFVPADGIEEKTTIVGAGLEFRRCVRERVVKFLVAPFLPPSLDAFLVCNAEKPTPELRVVAQHGDVPCGGDERLLHDIDAFLGASRS